MICIGKNKEIETLAQRHWNWFAQRIAYYQDESKLTDEEREKISEALKIKTALKNILGSLYDELELIIKADYSQLQKYKNELKFVYCEQSTELEKEEYKDATEKWKQQVKKVKGLSKKKKHDKLLINEHKNADKIRDILYKEKESKKKILEEIEKKNEEEWNRFYESTSYKFASNQDEDSEPIEKTLFELMGYDDFCKKDTDGNKKWNAYKLCEDLGVTVCPYCNRQYIFTVISDNCVRPQLDHFFPKLKYPLLSCSFYNLIPSCPSCNMLKNDKDVSLIYPYQEEFGKNGCFEIMLDDYSLIQEKKGITDSISVQISSDECNDVDTKEKIDNSKKIFLLDELYKKHQIELKDLLFRYSYFRRLTKKQLEEWGLIDADISLKDLLLGLPMMSNDDVVHPLKKMKKDIITQLEQNDK